MCGDHDGVCLLWRDCCSSFHHSVCWGRQTSLDLQEWEPHPVSVTPTLRWDCHKKRDTRFCWIVRQLPKPFRECHCQRFAYVCGKMEWLSFSAVNLTCCWLLVMKYSIVRIQQANRTGLDESVWKDVFWLATITCEQHPLMSISTWSLPSTRAARLCK